MTDRNFSRQLGLSADPAAIQALSIIPGATDRHGIMPFWQAVLGYDPRPDSPDEVLIDPHGRLAPFWSARGPSIASSGCRGTRRSRAWRQAWRRGGRMVRRNLEENFWTLADPAGNEVDVATTSAPDESQQAARPCRVT